MTEKGMYDRAADIRQPDLDARPREQSPQIPRSLSRPNRADVFAQQDAVYLHRAERAVSRTTRSRNRSEHDLDMVNPSRKKLTLDIKQSR